MERSTVAVVRCEDYDADHVYDALRRGIEALGGLDRFVRPGERILLKPNILAGEEPDRAVTTHPVVLGQCVRLLREGGAAVLFGDSPGLENATHAATRAGLLEAGIRQGAEWGDMGPGATRPNDGGTLVTHFPLVRAMQEADGIVNLPKMKTHQLTRVTGAVKNLFGCVPGKRKAAYHVQFPSPTDFCRLLVELGLTLQPRLHIMDGIVAMEGNGPRSGDPRAMKALILSDDPVAVDATFCRMVALDPSFVPTTAIGEKLGLGHYQEGAIAYVGDALEAFVQRDFRLIRKPVYDNASYAFFSWSKDLVLPRPVIDEGRCTQCGQCVKACPVPEKAIRLRDGSRGHPPVYHYDLCIRCYCCHEMCPNRAIHKRTPILGRVLRVA